MVDPIASWAVPLVAAIMDGNPAIVTVSLMTLSGMVQSNR